MRNVEKMAMCGALALGVAVLIHPSSGLAQSTDMTQPATAPQPDATMATPPASAQPDATATQQGLSTAQTDTAMPGSAPASSLDSSMSTPSGLVRTPDGALSNGPVPDTKANRARFGGPMSNAGKKSAPAGN
jgi:hypothetical protein